MSAIGNGKQELSVVRVWRDHLANPALANIDINRAPISLTKEAACALFRIERVAVKEKIQLRVDSAFRTLQFQELLEVCHRSPTARECQGIDLKLNREAPNESLFGLANTIKFQTTDPNIDLWLLNNAGAYGFYPQGNDKGVFEFSANGAPPRRRESAPLTGQVQNPVITHPTDASGRVSFGGGSVVSPGVPVPMPQAPVITAVSPGFQLDATCGPYQSGAEFAIQGNGMHLVQVVPLVSSDLFFPNMVRMDPSRAPNAVTRHTACAFHHMKEAARRDGRNLLIVEGFRSYAFQNTVSSCRRGIASPECRFLDASMSESEVGRSIYGMGTTIRISLADPAVDGWLRTNAGRFGFGAIGNDPSVYSFRP
jgi:LAS superfamily LD-carboxypeptidase LdcB